MWKYLFSDNAHDNLLTQSEYEYTKSWHTSTTSQILQSVNGTFNIIKPTKTLQNHKVLFEDDRLRVFKNTINKGIQVCFLNHDVEKLVDDIIKISREKTPQINELMCKIIKKLDCDSFDDYSSDEPEDIENPIEENFSASNSNEKISPPNHEEKFSALNIEENFSTLDIDQQLKFYKAHSYATPQQKLDFFLSNKIKID